MRGKIYTRTGDKGKTSLYGGKRVDKHHHQVAAYGTVDELNSSLGVAVSHLEDNRLRDFFTQIQNDLFTVGTHLAGNLKQDLTVIGQRIFEMEKEIDRMNQMLPVLKNFILPTGTKSASFLHLSRSICRRAERDVIALSKKSDVDKRIKIYLNRLSDLFFQTARFVNHESGVRDSVWKPS